MDTHILIWCAAKADRLPARARALVTDDRNERLFSAASIWEVAIKTSLGKIGFDLDPQRFLTAVRDAGFWELPITAKSALGVADLPFHHRDPFDRLLVAQAIDADAVLLTADTALAAYGPHVLLAR